jgi:hypothetical protein
MVRASAEFCTTRMTRARYLSWKRPSFEEEEEEEADDGEGGGWEREEEEGGEEEEEMERGSKVFLTSSLTAADIIFVLCVYVCVCVSVNVCT